MPSASGSSNSVTPVLLALLTVVAITFWLIWPSAADHAAIAEQRAQEAALKAHIERFAVPAPAPRKTRTVKYKVDGKGRASLTFTAPGGGTSQLDVRLPWTYEFEVAPGARLYLSGQLRQHGVITSSIFIDGKEANSTYSAGEYVIASTQTIVPAE